MFVNERIRKNVDPADHWNDAIDLTLKGYESAAMSLFNLQNQIAAAVRVASSYFQLLPGLFTLPAIHRFLRKAARRSRIQS